jgi:hypothetical protein
MLRGDGLDEECIGDLAEAQSCLPVATAGRSFVVIANAHSVRSGLLDRCKCQTLRQTAVKLGQDNRIEVSLSSFLWHEKVLSSDAVSTT